MQIFLENEQLKVTINSFGAELASVVKKDTGCEYLWNADGAFWKRSAPVLFPFVGSLKNKEYIHEGTKYPMGQHGFARDMEFTIESVAQTEVWFSLAASEETMKKYPFMFRLELGYRLDGRVLTVLWRVKNEDKTEMYFSIGGHPAFFCPLNGEGKQTDYYLAFDTEQNLKYSSLSQNGLVEKENQVLETCGGMMPIGEHLFDYDALIVEGKQAKQVSLCTPEKKPYLTVRFEAPLFGLWSPAGKHAPFICIEPWYGRCDKETFQGTLSEREYGQQLRPGESFEASYEIEVAAL